MAKNAGPGVRSLPAPYIVDTCSLISFAAQSDDVIFSRSDNMAVSQSLVDRFAIGPFTHQEYPWPASGRSLASGDITMQFDKLSTAKGALVGYLSYDAGLIFEQRWLRKFLNPLTGFAWRFAEVSCWYEADHVARTGQLMVHESADEEAVKNTRDFLTQGVKSPSRFKPMYPELKPHDRDMLGALGEFTKDAYEATVNSILEDVMAGRYYELNFTQRFRLTSQMDPSTAFKRLFNNLTPRRGFYFSIAGETVCSLSPELYLLKVGGKILTCPIKGSMKGATSSSEWEKLHAEHVMVVDLARNDLGRVSNLSPVRVQEFMRTDSFGGLKHLESVVTGHSTMDWKEVIRLTYPAASITGAPKVEVVTAIQDYERSRRKLYTGSCGWIMPNGDMDLNVAIRTAHAEDIKGEWHYEIGGGGAIVADSKPADEYFECLRKVAPLVDGIASE